MNSKCKVCQLNPDLVEKINAKLLDGESFESIVKWLKEQNIKITALSVMGHSRHLEGYKQKADEPKRENRKEQISIVKDEKIFHLDLMDQLDQLGIDLSKIDLEKENGIKALVTRYINEITLNQLGIVLEKQRMMMRGEGSHPSEEMIQLLKLLAWHQEPQPKRENPKFPPDDFPGLSGLPSKIPKY